MKFGFIELADGTQVFVHVSAVQDSDLFDLGEGVRLRFDITLQADGTGRLCATNLRLLT